LREEVDSADQYYADEVSNTRMYLDALTITHVDDTLQVAILDQDDSLAGLPAAISRGRPNMQCTLLAKADIISRFAIAAGELEASADALHLHLLGEGTPSHNFAPPQVTQGFQRYVGRRLVYAAAAALVVVASIWSGLNVYDTMRTADETAAMRRQTQDYQARYQQETAQFPEAPTSTDNLRNTVEIAEQLRQSVRMPEPMFTVVSHALDASPQIQLRRIEWKYGGQAEPGSSQASAVAGGPLVQTGILRGEVSPFNGDYKGAMTQINAFATQLAADPKVAEVHAIKLPFNASSDSGITGSTNTPGSAGGAEFEFAVTFKPGA
jgi:hypothetical protein